MRKTNEIDALGDVGFDTTFDYLWDISLQEASEAVHGLYDELLTNENEKE